MAKFHTFQDIGAIIGRKGATINSIREDVSLLLITINGAV